MAAKLDFALGAAVILMPQYGIPMFIGSSVGKFLLKKQHSNQSASHQSINSQKKQQVKLQWSHLSCQLTTKTGEIKHLLKDQSGIAKSKRYLQSCCACTAAEDLQAKSVVAAGF